MNRDEATVNRDLSLLIGILAALLGVLLLWVFHQSLATQSGDRLAGLAAEQVPNSGVSNPVTAVLLNFRAYDTLMELAVLLVALLGIWSLGPARPGFQRAGLALAAMVTWIVPLLILAIETAATVAIGVTLAAAYIGGRSDELRGARREEETSSSPLDPRHSQRLDK
jgi:hypothetical protein